MDRLKLKLRKNEFIIFFDGVCNLCDYLVNFVSQSEKLNPIYVTSLQGETAKELALTPDPTILKSVYVFNDGQIFEKSEAVILILLNLKKTRILGRILSIFPRWFLNFGYDLIGRYRYSIFGKKDSCRIPTQQEKNFFLP